MSRERHIKNNHSSNFEKKVQQLEWDNEQLKRGNASLRREIEDMEENVRKYKRQYENSEQTSQQLKWKCNSLQK